MKHWELTDREMQVLNALVAAEGCAKKAGGALFVSHKTIDAHVERIKSKMGSATRVGMLLTWDRWKRQESA